MSDLEQENTKLKLENEELKKQNNLLETKLKKYSNPDRSKKYYQAHKEELKKRNYKKTPATKEQRKKWNENYYEKNMKKEK